MLARTHTGTRMQTETHVSAAVVCSLSRVYTRSLFPFRRQRNRAVLTLVPRVSLHQRSLPLPLFPSRSYSPSDLGIHFSRRRRLIKRQAKTSCEITRGDRETLLPVTPRVCWCEVSVTSSLDSLCLPSSSLPLFALLFASHETFIAVALHAASVSEPAIEQE